MSRFTFARIKFFHQAGFR